MVYCCIDIKVLFILNNFASRIIPGLLPLGTIADCLALVSIKYGIPPVVPL